MLRKLVKYEIKATGRMLLPMFAASIVFSIVFAVMPTTYNLSNGLLGVSSLVSALLFYIFFLTSAGFSFFSSALRFRSNILGKEGYLMNTLPISPMKNISAKLISATLYQLVGILVAVISVGIVGGNFGHIFEKLKSFLSSASELSPGEWYELILSYLFMFLAIILFNVAVYAALSVGHSFRKAKLVISIGVFILLVVAGIYAYCMVETLLISAGIYFDTLTVIFEVLYIAIGLFITNYFLKNKLNLE